MTLAATSVTVAEGGVLDASFSFATSGAGCTPTASSFAGWITVGAPAAGTVPYSVAPNPFSTSRVGTIQVGDRTFTVTQTAGTCAFSLHEYGAVFGRAGGDGSVFGSPSALGCTPAVAVDLPAMLTLAPLSGPFNNIFTQPYTVAEAPMNTSVRYGRILFGGRLFVVKQVSW